MTRDIYIAIMVAAANGHGVHLSADEIAKLSRDEAIRSAAANALELAEWPDPTNTSPNWADINPYRKRTPANLTLNDSAR